ncbi:hypothetical protein [Halobaculum sp. D14]|uniref:hypothetical protein n=1 Tax=unclassified Halobaculum TaxID=2640896 RepID=UPI003EBFDC23
MNSEETNTGAAETDADAGAAAGTGASDDADAATADAAGDEPGGYVHRPGAVDGGDAAAADGDADDDEQQDLGRAGWVLVAVVVVAFLVVPGIIYLRPTTPDELGLDFLAAMLVLPFIPALLLGVTAVWSLAAGNRS